MAALLSLKRWERVELAHGLSCEVRRLNSLDAGPFRTAMAKAFTRLAELQAELQAAWTALPPDPVTPDGEPPEFVEGASQEDREAHSRAYRAWAEAHPDYIAALRAKTDAANKLLCRSREVEAEVAELIPPTLIRQAFREYVRNVEGVEVDGAPATSGEALLEVADDKIVMDVLGAVRRLSELTVREGKASASPSMSSPEGVTGAGDSGAKSTDAGAGPAS